MPKTIRATESYRESLLADLKDPLEAAHYLDASIRDDDPGVFLLALRDVAEAHGGLRTLSSQTRLNRENLYRMLSRSGNPSLTSLAAILNALGLRVTVQPAVSQTKPRRRRTA